MATKKAELRALITLAGKVDPSLQAAMLKAQGETAKVTKEMSKLGTITKGVFLGNMLTRAFQRTASFIKQAGADAIELASDLVEVQNVVDTVFDRDARTIDAWSKKATDAYGMTELQAKQYSGTLGAIMESAEIATNLIPEMSMRLAGISGDLASFYNLPYDDAFAKIQAGIAGQVLPLRQLGINMTVANLEAYALSKGINQQWNQMDQATQTMIRYSYIVSKTEKAQGDFVRTQGSYANQLKLLRTNWASFLAKLTTEPLDGLAEALGKVNKLITDIDVEKVGSTVTWAFNLFADSIGWVIDNSNWLIPVLSGVVGGLAAFKVITTVTRLMDFLQIKTVALTIAQKGLGAAFAANPIGLTVAAFAALVAVGVAVWRNWDKLVKMADKLWGAVKRFFGFGKGGGDVGSAVASATNLAAQTAGMDAYGDGGIAYRPSIFGEAGPEIAIPLKRTPRSLALLDQATQIIGGGSGDGGPSIVQNFHFGNADPEVVSNAARTGAEDAFERYGLSKARVSYGY